MPIDTSVFRPSGRTVAQRYRQKRFPQIDPGSVIQQLPVRLPQPGDPIDPTPAMVHPIGRYWQPGDPVDPRGGIELLRSTAPATIARPPQQNVYGQTIAGRGYAPGLPQPTTPSPQAEAIGAQIMREEQAAFDAQNRWRRKAAENLAGVQSTGGAWARAALPYAPAGFGASEAVAGRVPALMTPTMLAPSTPAAPTAGERLAQQMLAQYPGVEETPVQSRLYPGQSLGRFSAPFTGGGINEYAKAMSEYRDKLAAGEEAQYPGAYRAITSETPPATLAAMKGQENVAKQRRLARRERQKGTLLPEEIRQRMVMGNAQGRQLTPLQAQIEINLEGKRARGQELSPVDIMHELGPEAGQVALQHSNRMTTLAIIQGLTSAMGATTDPVIRADIAKQITGAIKGLNQAQVAGGAKTGAGGTPSPTPPLSKPGAYGPQGIPMDVHQQAQSRAGGNQEAYAKALEDLGIIPSQATAAGETVFAAPATAQPFGDWMVEQFPFTARLTAGAAGEAGMLSGLPQLAGIPPAALAKLRERAKTDPKAAALLEEILRRQQAAQEYEQMVRGTMPQRRAGTIGLIQ